MIHCTLKVEKNSLKPLSAIKLYDSVERYLVTTAKNILSLYSVPGLSHELSSFLAQAGSRSNQHSYFTGEEAETWLRKTWLLY